MAEVEYSNNVTFASGDDLDSEWDEVTHVVYVEDPDDTQVRWGGNADPRGVLTPGETYEVELVSVHSWHTKIFLVGVDCGRGFNSVSFEPVLESE
jgi:hypothetical protein